MTSLLQETLAATVKLKSEPAALFSVRRWRSTAYLGWLALYDQVWMQVRRKSKTSNASASKLSIYSPLWYQSLNSSLLIWVDSQTFNWRSTEEGRRSLLIPVQKSWIAFIRFLSSGGPPSLCSQKFSRLTRTQGKTHKAYRATFRKQLQLASGFLIPNSSAKSERFTTSLYDLT